MPRLRLLTPPEQTHVNWTNMSDGDNLIPRTRKAAVCCRLRVPPWDAKSSVQGGLKLFCGPDAFRLLAPCAKAATPANQAGDNQPAETSDDA